MHGRDVQWHVGPYESVLSPGRGSTSDARDGLLSMSAYFLNVRATWIPYVVHESLVDFPGLVTCHLHNPGFIGYVDGSV